MCTRTARCLAGMPLALALLLGLGASPSAALANSPGGTRGPSAAAAGGSEFGVPAHARSAPARPVITRLTVPTTAAPGPPPVVTLQIDEAGSGTVDTRVAILSLTTHRPVVAVALGWVPTGRILVVRWPSHARLAPGSYHVSVKAQDAHGVSLLRRAHASGVATLDVRAPAPVTAPAPAPTPTPTPTPTPAGAPTPAETVADGAVFPVAGTHSFGGPENRFGAPRAGHVHQGQDVLTAEGTPVLAPLAGVITSTAVQAGGAGYYLVEHTGYGLDFMFAHCQAGSFAVAQGQSVSAGTVLCHAGQTGDATTPHLHIEIWVGRWQEAGGYPIDPLPYLQAWESA